MKTFIYSGIIVASLALGAIASAQTHIGPKGYPNKIGVPKMGLTGQDLSFMKAAAAGNQFEIKSSEVALKNGSGMFVKGFAKKMIQDHSGAYEELKVTGMKKGVKVSKTLPAPLQATVDKLMTLHGAAFNAAYLKAQKAGHADTAAAFEKEIRTGHEEAVKDYAIKILPAVKMHQKMLATMKLM